MSNEVWDRIMKTLEGCWRKQFLIVLRYSIIQALFISFALFPVKLFFIIT